MHSQLDKAYLAEKHGCTRKCLLHDLQQYALALARLATTLRQRQRTTLEPA